MNGGPDRDARSLWSRLGGFLRRDAEASLRDSLEEVLEEHEESASPIGEEERSILLNVATVGELTADDVMVPRADIVATDITTPLRDALAVFIEAGHSRLPVYRDSLDQIVGMVHIKDAVAALMRHADDQPVGELKRPILFIPPSMPVLDVLRKMRAKRLHMALVVDEYGGADGLVTIEDVVEEIIGEIEDEHDVAGSPLLVACPDGAFDVDARVPIEELEQLFGLDLLTGEMPEDIDTAGGLVVDLAGRVPAAGEVISHPAGLDFEVLAGDARRVKRLRVRHRLSRVGA